MNTVSPALRRVIETYTQAPGLDIYSVSPDRLDLSGDTACLIVQQPGFLGQMEDVEALSKQAHVSGALLVVSADPMSLGMFKPPAEYDADIVVGEGQTLGIPPTYGGPYVGLFACKQKYIRQMPGRIVGKAVDTQGSRGLRPHTANP